MACASHFRDVVGGDAGAAACEGDAGAAACGVAGACGVAVATRTVSPAVRVSGGLSMMRSDGDRPAMTSTLSPRSRPSCTFLTPTLLLLSRVATCLPCVPVTSAVEGILTRLASAAIWKSTLQELPAK